MNTSSNDVLLWMMWNGFTLSLEQASEGMTHENGQAILPIRIGATYTVMTIFPICWFSSM
jgi:hypothetical protein